MKRFWKSVTIETEGTAFGVRLDSRPVKLPSGAPLYLPYGALAQGVADEWSAIGTNFTPEDLPFTRLASTAQERIPQHRDNIIGQLAAYGLNDLLSYRADTPEPLVARQHEQWDPWLDWANATLDVCLLTTTGLMPVNQLPWSGDRFAQKLATYSDYTLAALGVIVPALGSLVLGLAVAEGALTAADACAAAFLDELWQAEQWGEDDEALQRRAHAQNDIILTARFMALCTP